MLLLFNEHPAMRKPATGGPISCGSVSAELQYATVVDRDVRRGVEHGPPRHFQPPGRVGRDEIMAILSAHHD